jgi:hypothetical protein
LQTATKKKKKDDKASSDEDEDDGYEDDDEEDDDDQASAILDRDGVSRTRKNKMIEHGIRIKIKGEGDEEDIIFTAKDRADAKRKLAKEHGISISVPTIKSRLEGISNGKPCKNFYDCPRSLKRIV